MLKFKDNLKDGKTKFVIRDGDEAPVEVEYGLLEDDLETEKEEENQEDKVENGK